MGSSDEPNCARRMTTWTNEGPTSEPRAMDHPAGLAAKVVYVAVRFMARISGKPPHGQSGAIEYSEGKVEGRPSTVKGFSLEYRG
jgi:hypothetical protein